MQTQTSENDYTGTSFIISKKIISQLHFSLAPVTPELNVLFDILANFEKDHSQINFKTQNIQLISEEVFVNIVNYGKSKDCIEFLIGHNDNELFIQFVDSGIPFNPCEHGSKPKDITSLDDEIQIGGLGIVLMKKMSKEVLYQRSNGKNFLCIVFDL